MNRDTAIANKLPRYTGRVCTRHPEQEGARYTASYACVGCSLDAVKRNQAKQPDVIAARAQEYRANNKEKVRESFKRWADGNKAQLAESKRQHRIRNNVAIRAKYKQYYEDNYPRMLAKRNKQHADRLQRTPVWLTVDDFWMIDQAYELAALRSKMFGFSWHVDHVIPLRGKKVSGLHAPLNLQVIPGTDNLRKTNNFIG